MSGQIIPAGNFVDKVYDETPDERELRILAEIFVDMLDDDGSPECRRKRFTERWFRAIAG
jgi:hypothetical protein